MHDSKTEPNPNVGVTIGDVQKLIYGRLAVIFALLLAIWWWTSSYLDLPGENFPVGLFALFVFSLGLSTVYLLLLRFNKSLFWQIRAQFLADILLITWLVWVTGDLISPYVTLYIILVGVAGFYFGNLETLFFAGFCAISFSMLSILSSQSLIYSFSGEVRPSRFVQIIAFNNVAILIVGLLAARFSERYRVGAELKESIERFAELRILHERIVESIQSGLITTDLDGKIYTFNRTAEEISGLEANEIVGQSLFSIFSEDIRSPVDSCLRAFQSNESSTEHFEARILANSEEGVSPSTVTIACSVAPLVGKSGNVYGLILTFQDITQIRAMEETLRRSDRLAAIGRMSAGLAHEIRNPLGSMSSALQFLQSKVPAAEASLMDVVLRESDRLNSIITNFLSYARPASDGFSKETYSGVDLNQTILDCFVLLRHSPEVKENHLFDSQLPKTPVVIHANQTQIKQIFWNLLQNSIQAMPNGGKLVVSLTEISARNVRIIIQDTGEGISPEYLKQLFEPFSDSARGTGLGLSIVHKIISEHGGHLDIQSQLGEGTKITIELPT